MSSLTHSSIQISLNSSPPPDRYPPQLSQHKMVSESEVSLCLSVLQSLIRIHVCENETFVTKPITEGVFHGKGHGVIMCEESEMAAFLVIPCNRIGCVFLI